MSNSAGGIMGNNIGRTMSSTRTTGEGVAIEPSGEQLKMVQKILGSPTKKAAKSWFERYVAMDVMGKFLLLRWREVLLELFQRY
jgi:hypothetical protein